MKYRIHKDGSIIWEGGAFVSYDAGDKTICLDGYFNADALIFLAEHIKKHSKEKNKCLG